MFLGKPWHILGRKKSWNKNFTALLSWRESSSLSIHSNWRAQFYNSKNVAFLQIKGKKDIKLSLKCTGSKTISYLSFGMYFFRMTKCSYRYTSCTSFIAEDSKDINQYFLKH